MKKLSQNKGKVLLSVCEIVLGILLFIDPVGFTGSIIRLIGILLILAGLFWAFRYFRTDPVEAHLEQGLAKALCAFVGGVFCILRTEWFIITFPVITLLYGVGILLTGIVRIQWAVDMLRVKMEGWYLAVIGAVLSVVFAGIILVDPFASTEFLWQFLAVALIVNAVVDLAIILFSKTYEEKIQ